MAFETIFLGGHMRQIAEAVKATDPYTVLAKAVAEDSEKMTALGAGSTGEALYWHPVAKNAYSGEAPAPNTGWMRYRANRGDWVPHVRVDRSVTLRKLYDPKADTDFETKHPRKGGRFAPKGTYDQGGEHEIAFDDIRGVSAGKGGLHVEHGDGSKRVIPPEKAGDFLTWHGKHTNANERAEQFVSPNDATHMSMDDSIKAIGGEQQAWLTRTCQDVDKFTGLKSQVMSSVGVWKDPSAGVDTENSTFSAISKVPDDDTLRYAAALKGLAANQKAVLNVVLDPKGQDSLYHISIPHDTSDVNWKRNLTEIQGVMDTLGLEAATFVRTPHGTDVVLFEQGGDKQLEGAKKLAMHFNATGENAKCTGEFIGAYKPDLDDAGQREASAQEFRSIVYGFEKQHGVHYEFKELPPEEQEKVGPMPAQSKGAGRQMRQVAKSLGGLSGLRLIQLTAFVPGGNLAAKGE